MERDSGHLACSKVRSSSEAKKTPDRWICSKEHAKLVIVSKPQVVLKSHYHLEHFEEMLEFVATHYGHALEERHLEFLSDFRSLSRDARSLYVRFANRKGRIFYREYLRYPEISDIPEALRELEESSFVGKPSNEHYRELLVLQTKPLLVERLRQSNTESPPPSSAKKSLIVEHLIGSIPFGISFPDECLAGYVLQRQVALVDYLLFLFFGELRSGMTAFALRDLGVLKGGRFKKEFQPRFETLESALSAFRYSKLSLEIEGSDHATLIGIADEAVGWRTSDDPEVEDKRHRTLHRLGRQLERSGDAANALRVYRVSDRFPSTERTARLLVQNGEREEAGEFLSRLIDDPSCDEELFFAEDFYERKFEKKKTGRLTSLLRGARVISLDESSRDRPEAAAVRFFRSEGAEAVHVENVIWNQLFGLLFWEFLFDTEDAAIHNEFEIRPQGLHSEGFFQKFGHRIETVLALSPGGMLQRLTATWEAKEKTPNGLFPWHGDMFDAACRLVEAAPAGAVATILLEMSKNHKLTRSGFPDLIVFRDNQVSFAEIKAEGDSIRRNQLVQMERLRNAGFPVEVIRVLWTVDPEQEYVVVDVETTGGAAQWNRVTEIGAVRMRGDEILEEWSSLINPERRIPKNIVSLTGITDEMVEQAPTFREIADDFRAFLGEAVFAAHRAQFDYGFIREEFRRIGEDLYLPKFCTVAGARRYFPGLPSYGLANLCREFGIPLESHHRALCDARATAKILARINQKRSKLVSR